MQDSKNLIIAIVLCLIVIVGWGYLAEHMGWTSKPAPVAQQQQNQQVPQQLAQTAPAPAQPSLPVFTPSAGRDITVDTPLYEAVVYSGGGALRSFKLKKFQVGLAADSPLVNMVDPKTAQVGEHGGQFALIAVNCCPQ